VYPRQTDSHTPSHAASLHHRPQNHTAAQCQGSASPPPLLLRRPRGATLVSLVDGSKASSKQAQATSVADRLRVACLCWPVRPLLTNQPLTIIARLLLRLRHHYYSLLTTHYSPTLPYTTPHHPADDDTAPIASPPRPSHARPPSHSPFSGVDLG